MAHFANVQNGAVTEVIVVPDEHENGVQEYLSGLGLNGNWVQTSYNTYGNEHSEGKSPLRGNFAGPGYVYDDQLDVFYEPQPFASWHLDPDTFLWEPPYPAPNEFCYWDEDRVEWVDPRIP